MTEGKITERTLYPPINKFLGELGFQSVSEIKFKTGQLDILAKIDDETFIIEIKIGDKSKKLIEGLSQAMRYSKEYNTHNIIVLNYPPEIRTAFINDLEELALNTLVNTAVFTDYLNYHKDIAVSDLLALLKSKIVSETSEISLNTVIKIISESIQEINSTLKKISEEDMENLINLITGKFDLFMALSELKKKDEVKDMAINIVGYLIVNQILFYHVYSKKSGLIPELTEIKQLKDLISQFDKITDINYKVIYQIDLISKLPENKEITESLNKVIQIFKIAKPENIEHDLIGRLFHDLLPYETRKILAAFYTNPIAAEILANLIIEKSNSLVIDPACGSGTLLVSAYRRKKELSEEEITEIHKQFVEEEISGLDIMPFAAHLTAVNLSSQSIESTTDKLRVGVMDSLSLSEKLKKHRVYRLESFSRELQTTLHLFGPTKRLTGYLASDSTGAVSADGDAGEFKLNRNSFDICMANPPFSDREKMPNSYLEVLNTYKEINTICGAQVNLWGYFLALCDKLLKKNGIMGFVIPINIFRGKATEKIRNHILENYKIKYVVKSGKNTAFSENASLRDVLFIAERRKPKQTDTTRFIIINEDLHELTFEDADNISKYIKGESFTSGRDLDVIDYDYELIIKNKNNLMPLFGLMNTNSGKVLGRFNTEILDKFGNFIRKISKDEVSEGFHASPAGLSQMAFITNNFGPNRVKRAFLTIKKEHDDHIDVDIKGLPEKTFKIDKTILEPAFRTLTDINTLDIGDKLDFIITDTFKDYELVLNLSKFKNKDKFSYNLIKQKMENKWTYLVTARRFRPNSKNTCLFAFCSDKKFVAPDTFKNIYLDLESAKINCLYLNSVMGVLNLTLLKEQTTEAYTDIREQINSFDIIDLNKINEKQKSDLLKLYDNLKDYKFPSLIEQFDNHFEGRVKLDSELLQILGFNKSDIEEILPEVYDAIVFELKNG
jgi:tRNA1(Val) A37 N6-methylase TrmN6